MLMHLILDAFPDASRWTRTQDRMVLSRIPFLLLHPETFGSIEMTLDNI